MPVLAAYERFRFLWGAVDWQAGTDHPYDSSQTGATLGPSAAAGAGVGVRRCVLKFDRTGVRLGEDDANMHFDFLNITGGDPDDSWTTADYTTVEGFLNTWWAAVKGTVTSGYKLASYNWYRHGPGIVPPNPAERVQVVGVAGAAAAFPLPPQDACTITFRTAVRRSWGRTYIPGLTTSWAQAGGTYPSSIVDIHANAAGALLTSAVGADFPLVVTSVHLSAVLNVEQIEVDDNPDIQRRRRWSGPTYRKILP